MYSDACTDVHIHTRTLTQEKKWNTLKQVKKINGFTLINLVSARTMAPLVAPSSGQCTHHGHGTSGGIRRVARYCTHEVQSFYLSPLIQKQTFIHNVNVFETLKSYSICLSCNNYENDCRYDFCNSSLLHNFCEGPRSQILYFCHQISQIKILDSF